MTETGQPEERVLVLAPTGRDGRLVRETLETSGIHSELCASIEDLCNKASETAGALFIAEEALTLQGIAALSAMIDRQPPWSDIPVIISTGMGATSSQLARSLDSIGVNGNITVLERPVRILTMVATIQASLRARRRQYQMRNLAAQLEHELMEQVKARGALEISRAEADAARAAAESANRAKDEFLAMLGHELRNPLAPILTALQLMRLRDGADTKERSIIERQARHMAGLVDDLLDVSRITQQKIELKREVMELGGLLAAAVETAAPLLEKRRHRLETQILANQFYVDGDPTRLVQVFSNILNNAAKYTDEGGRIRIDASTDGETVAIRIADNGRGISPEMLPHVFELFSQEHQNLDRAQGGLGLGLALVKSLVEMHGGKVLARSEGNGRGSEFIVTLPAAKAPPIALAKVADSHRGEGRSSGSEARHLPRLRPAVLVVDDNRDAAEMLVAVLGMMGYTARVAHDGLQALTLASKEAPPDAAFVDIGLPVMDGYELAHKLRQLPGWKGVSLVAVTGYGQERDRKQSIDAGFDAHLVKPIGLAALQRVLDNLAADGRPALSSG